MSYVRLLATSWIDNRASGTSFGFYYHFNYNYH